MSSERPTKRARSAIACRRCKRRKQRCDNAFPACAACVSVNEACSYENKVYPAEYVESLEDRVAELENSPRSGTRRQSNHLTSPSVSLRTHGDRHDVAQEATAGGNGLTDPGFDMLSSSSFLGTSSGFPLSQAVQAVIGPAISQSFERERIEHGSVSFASREASTPEASLGAQLVEVYLNKVHPKHPFMSASRVFRLHEAHRASHSSSNIRTSAVRLDSFILHMVYAIGARYHQLSQNQYHCSPEAYYATAMKDAECLLQSHVLESIEGMLLLVIFQLRSPMQQGLWSMVGLTMRHAVSLGLHRKFNGNAVVDQRRKRIFWTVYMLERSIARTLGRPMCISDRDIDVDLPANVSEDIDDDSEILSALQINRGMTSMSAAIHIFRLARLESKIYSCVHRVDRPISEISMGKIARLRQLIEEWRDQISSSVPYADNDGALAHYYTTESYHILHYHQALLLLLLPSLTTFSIDTPDFKLCIASAGQVCQLYKRLHDYQTVHSYSIIALHATFVAGLTLIYCYVADPTILNMQLSRDIRACSTVLYVISERWSAARKVRDAFERLLSLTVESLDHVRDTGITSNSQFDETWSDLMAQASYDDILDHSDIWNSLGPWFEMSEESWLRDT